MKKILKKLLIAGPCAVENDKQMEQSFEAAKEAHVDFIRLSLWKPRTKPGFEGVGTEGIKYHVKAAKMGLNPSTEIMMPDHAREVMEKVLPALKKNGRLLLWIGARNQNHYLQREISKIVAQDKRVLLMVKNQIWHNEKHWEGIVEHILEGGINKENFILSHRGFAPMGYNPHAYRNVPDYDMAMRMKDKTGLQMIFDPSHTGGSVEKVFQIAEEANRYPFDGYIIEVHPHPKEALSDANQQLTWSQYKQLQKTLSIRSRKELEQ
jgi:3-deoxy-7-phosphoheptulonate synthase